MTKRPAYDLLDVIRTARRWEGDNSFMVLPPDIAAQLETELTRLYNLEDAINEQAVRIATNQPYYELPTLLERIGILPT